jgi:4-hydroxybenzoate polyprenyltransferase
MTEAVPQDAIPASWVDRTPAWAKPYLRLARMDRPIGSWLLFWPCAWGLALAAIGGTPISWTYLLLFGVGAVVMRGAGCAYNDIIDRDIDAKVERTRGRPLPSGQLSVVAAVLFALGLSIAGLQVLQQFNGLAIGVGFASLLFVAAYPFMKRVTWWPQAWLGLTFNWGVLVAYAAATEQLSWAMLCLYLAGVAWTLGYDTIYALQDMEDDALAGVKSSALALGPKAKPAIAVFYTAAVLFMALAVLLAGGAPLALLAVAPFAGHLLMQARAVRLDDPASALRLFRANATAGGLAFLGLFAVPWIG